MMDLARQLDELLADHRAKMGRESDMLRRFDYELMHGDAWVRDTLHRIQYAHRLRRDGMVTILDDFRFELGGPPKQASLGSTATEGFEMPKMFQAEKEEASTVAEEETEPHVKDWVERVSAELEELLHGD